MPKADMHPWEGLIIYISSSQNTVWLQMKSSPRTSHTFSQKVEANNEFTRGKQVLQKNVLVKDTKNFFFEEHPRVYAK